MRASTRAIQSAGLSGAGRHAEKEPTTILLNALHDRPDGLELEIAPGDSCVDQFFSKGFLVLPNEEEAFEVLPCREAMDLSGRRFAKFQKKISWPLV